MTPVICFSQEGQLSAETAEHLGAELDAFSRNAFDRPARVRWVIVAEGDGFAAAEPSTAVVVSMRADQPLDRRRRADLLGQLSEVCAARTGKAPGELVLSIFDPES